jgi:hypothetical protein
MKRSLAMFRLMLAIVVLGISVIGSSGCGMGRGITSAPAPAKKEFVVEGMKHGQWQMVAGYPTSRAAAKRAETERRGGEFQAVRIRDVASSTVPLALLVARHFGDNPSGE